MTGFITIRNCVLASTAAAVLLAPAAPAAEDTEGKWLADLRLRYETVDDANCTACAGRDATAFTLRARLGYDTGTWQGFGGLIEIDQIWSLGDEEYNSTRNGQMLYPVVADPELTQLNRLQISYTGSFDTVFTLGRQRLAFGNQRFIGNVGWRQHEQTFDAFSIVNASVEGLTLTYAYIARVNRIFGDDNPVPTSGQAPHFDSHSHVFDVAYTGWKGVKLEAYGLMLDLAQTGPSPLTAARLSTSTWGLRAEGKFEASPGLNVLLNAEYAHQNEYADNPLTIDLSYWLAEAGLSWKGATLLAGYQSLEGDGTVGFSTPLATGHAFNGWADIFLTTPTNGLDAAYVKLAYAVPDAFGLKSVGGALNYYDFEMQRTGVSLGSEVDVQLEVAIDKQFTVLLKYADYRGDGALTGAGGWTPAARDKTVAWAVVSFKY